MNALIFALLLAQDKAIVEGTVVNALTNEPLRKAHVLLEGEKQDTRSSPAMKESSASKGWNPATIIQKPSALVFSIPMTSRKSA